MHPQKFPILLAFFACAAAAPLVPLLTIPDQVIFQPDFSVSGAPDKSNFGAKQGTRWIRTNGVLRGLPSTAEYQASHKDHKGTEARLALLKCPASYAIGFSFRFEGGAFTGATPMIELGHHVTRVQWTTNGVRLLADHDGLQVAQDTSFKLKTNEWVRALAEVRGDAVLFQFEGGPTLYASHASIAGDNHAFGIAGFKGGAVELKDLTIWSVKPGAPEAWEKTRAALPAQTPVELPTKKK